LWASNRMSSASVPNSYRGSRYEPWESDRVNITGFIGTINAAASVSFAGAKTGATGPTGASSIGPRGPQGPTGFSMTGNTGPTGASIAGIQGPTGPPASGSTGPTGAQGSSIAGPTGAVGISITGATGPTGSSALGPTGSTGPSALGLTGMTGPTGATGSGSSISYGIIPLSNTQVQSGVITSITGSGFTSQGSAISYTPGSTGIQFIAGIYDIIVSSDWGTDILAGYRQITLTDGVSFSISNQVASAGSSSDTIQQLNWIGQITQNTTLYVQASQNSGQLIVLVPNANSYLTAVKIG
jgi:hypothetical protein